MLYCLIFTSTLSIAPYYFHFTDRKIDLEVLNNLPELVSNCVAIQNNSKQIFVNSKASSMTQQLVISWILGKVQ